MLERKRTVAEPTAKEPEKPDEIFIHPSYYSLTIDRGKDQKGPELEDWKRRRNNGQRRWVIQRSCRTAHARIDCVEPEKRSFEKVQL